MSLYDDIVDAIQLHVESTGNALLCHMAGDPAKGPVQIARGIFRERGLLWKGGAIGFTINGAFLRVLIAGLASCMVTSAMEHKENLSDQITGSVAVFETSLAYAAGRLEVYLNGMHLGCSGDGFKELTDTTFSVTTHVPLSGEIIVVRYYKK